MGRAQQLLAGVAQASVLMQFVVAPLAYAGGAARQVLGSADRSELDRSRRFALCFAFHEDRSRGGEACDADR